MNVLEKLEKAQVCGFDLSESKRYMNVYELCDGYYSTNLSKTEVQELIKALSALHQNMITEDAPPTKEELREQKKATFHQSLKDCAASLDEIHKKAKKAATRDYNKWKSHLSFCFEAEISDRYDVLQEYKEKFRHERHNVYFKEDDTREKLVNEVLPQMYGKSQDGLAVYDYIYKGYLTKFKQEYLSLPTFQ